MTGDLREVLFSELEGRSFYAELTPERDGILSGAEEAAQAAQALGITWLQPCQEGMALHKGVPFASFRAFPKQIAEAEEIVIGTLAKASGIATAASQAVSLSGERMKIVSGAWKKMPPPLKGMVRRAVCTGGAHFRICEPPMLYLDKNYICMFGSVERTLQGAEQLPGLRRVVQIRGKLASIAEETRQAVCGGGDILMVDTGSRQDLHDCQRQLRQMGCRMQVQIAFAGDVHLRDIPELRCEDIDILGIGKDIVDAPLLDMRLDVVEEVCV